MKTTIIYREEAAKVVWNFRRYVKKYKEQPTGQAWGDVNEAYWEISALHKVGLLSFDARRRALNMFYSCD